MSWLVLSPSGDVMQRFARKSDAEEYAGHLAGVCGYEPSVERAEPGLDEF